MWIILIIRACFISSVVFVIIFSNIYIVDPLTCTIFWTSWILWTTRCLCLLYLTTHHCKNVLRLADSFSMSIAASCSILLAILLSLWLSWMWLVCIIWPSDVISLVILLIWSILLLTWIHVWSWLMLMALIELIANSIILHVCIYEMLESIVMTVHLERIWNNMFYTIIVASDFNLINNSILARTTMAWWYFWKDFVVMACYEQIWNSISRSYFNFAIMAS